MKRIAIVVSHPIQHFCPQYASIAAIEGIQLRVFFGSAMGFTRYYDKLFGKEISWGNLYLDRFDHVFLNGHQNIPADTNLDAPVLNEQLDEFKPDLVIVYGYFQKLSKRAMKWARKNKVKIGYIADSKLDNSKRKAIKSFAKSIYLSYFFRSIDFFLCVGYLNRLHYKKYGVEDRKIKRMHFPIDIELYKTSWETKEKSNRALREKLGLSPDDLVISMVGKLVGSKNHAHLVEAASLLEQKGHSVNVFIIGSGEEEELIKKKAEGLKHSKVFMTGFVAPEDLPQYYAASDIYVHAAEIEAHSLAISEAIYMGVPVIISDRCGSYGEDDDVQENTNGYVYEWSNIEALAGYISRFINDRRLLTEFGRKSREISVSLQELSHRDCWKQLINEL